VFLHLLTFPENKHSTSKSIISSKTPTLQATPVKTSTTINYSIPASALAAGNKASIAASDAQVPGNTTYNTTH
jgi:hypothetical protein